MSAAASSDDAANRVWDSFLTEQDRVSLRPRPELAWGIGRKPALLLIDLYVEVFGEVRETLPAALQRWPSSCGEAGWNALPYIERLLALARELNLPIVHVTAIEPADAVPAWSRRVLSGRTTIDADGTAHARAPRYDFHPVVRPRLGETIIRKSAPSAFSGTPLHSTLRGLEVDTLVVCGETTSGCVRATVVDGRTNLFKVLVVEDAVFDRHQASHAINLFDMHQKYADVLSVGRITVLLTEWARAGSRTGTST